MSYSNILLLFALLIIDCAMKSNISNYDIELATKRIEYYNNFKEKYRYTQINLVIMLIKKLKDLII